MQPLGRLVNVTRKVKLRANRLEDLGRSEMQALAEACVCDELGLPAPDPDLPVGNIASRIWVVIDGERPEGPTGSDIVVRIKINPTQAVIGGWSWGDGHLLPWPPPLWRGQVVRPREDLKPRKRTKTKCASKKRDQRHPLKCPRCGWFASHLVIPYYDSPWAVWGGLCGECCIEAEEHFDEAEWPKVPIVAKDRTEKEGMKMLKAVFGMGAKSKSKVDENQNDLGIDTEQSSD